MYACMCVYGWQYNTKRRKVMIWQVMIGELVGFSFFVSVSFWLYWGNNGYVLVWCDVVLILWMWMWRLLCCWGLCMKWKEKEEEDDDEKCSCVDVDGCCCKFWFWLNQPFTIGMGWIGNGSKDDEKEEVLRMRFITATTTHITSHHHHTCTYLWVVSRECFEYRRRWRLKTILYGRIYSSSSYDQSTHALFYQQTAVITQHHNAYPHRQYIWVVLSCPVLSCLVLWWGVRYVSCSVCWTHEDKTLQRGENEKRDPFTMFIYHISSLPVPGTITQEVWQMNRVHRCLSVPSPVSCSVMLCPVIYVPYTTYHDFWSTTCCCFVVTTPL